MVVFAFVGPLPVYSFSSLTQAFDMAAETLPAVDGWGSTTSGPSTPPSDLLAVAEEEENEKEPEQRLEHKSPTQGFAPPSPVRAP